MIDKRKFERYEINVPVRMKLLARAQGQVQMTKVKNVSAEGIFIKSKEPLREKAQVGMEIILHFDELISPADAEGTLVIAATGRVLRSGPEGTAIRFNDDYELRKPWHLTDKRIKKTVASKEATSERVSSLTSSPNGKVRPPIRLRKPQVRKQEHCP